VVLGESKQSVHDWSLIRVLIRKLGRQSLKTRITNFQFDQCERWRLEYAQSLIATITLDAIRDVSAGAATFYVWIKSLDTDEE